jgi:hypothetical protein
MKIFTVSELIQELRRAAGESPLGENAKVCLDDFEGNMGAFGPIQTLEVVYDEDTSHVTILCDRHEALEKSKA